MLRRVCVVRRQAAARLEREHREEVERLEKDAATAQAAAAEAEKDAAAFAQVRGRHCAASFRASVKPIPISSMASVRCTGHRRRFCCSVCGHKELTSTKSSVRVLCFPLERRSHLRDS